MDDSILQSPSLVNHNVQRYVELSNSLRRKKTRNNEGQDVLTLKKEFDDLKATNVQLQSTVIELEDYADVLFDQIELNITQINELQRYTRRENIEIVGIPETVSQNDLEQTVIGILASINVKVNSYNIASCHRLKLNEGPVADPGWGFEDLSLVNNYHLTSIIFSVVSK